MLANMADLREQIGVASHDLEAIERILETLGYRRVADQGDPRAARGAVLPWRASRLPAQSLKEHGPTALSVDKPPRTAEIALSF